MNQLMHRCSDVWVVVFLNEWTKESIKLKMRKLRSMNLKKE